MFAFLDNAVNFEMKIAFCRNGFLSNETYHEIELAFLIGVKIHFTEGFLAFLSTAENENIAMQ